MNKFKGPILILIPLVVLILIAVLFSEEKEDTTTHKGWQDNLVVTNLCVGEADAAILQFEDEVGIIDTGEKDDFEYIYSFLKSIETTKISFMILTHYDKDHIGSAVSLIENMDIDTVFIPDYESGKALYPELIEALESHSNLHMISESYRYDWKGIEIGIYPAHEEQYYLFDVNNADNNMSLVTKLRYKDNELLFCGDIENERINELLDCDDDIACQWIKIPHHGRYGKGLKKLLGAVTPSYAVSSCSAEEGIDKKTIELFEKLNINAYDTMNSDVVSVFDGKNISVSNR